jgi:hypothetical protein
MTKRPLASALGDLDPKFWERDTKGQPIDPWVLTVYVQFTDPETGKVRFTFAGSSKGGLDAIGNLIDAYVLRRAEPGEHVLPLVELSADYYQHPDYGQVHKPIFEIVDWVPAAAPAAAPADVKVVSYADVKPRLTIKQDNPVEPPRTTRDDLNDELPY